MQPSVTILLIDDAPSFSMALARCLSRAGYTVDAGHPGAVVEWPPALVVGIHNSESETRPDWPNIPSGSEQLCLGTDPVAVVEEANSPTNSATNRSRATQ
jgi:hypothetical protein